MTLLRPAHPLTNDELNLARSACSEAVRMRKENLYRLLAQIEQQPDAGTNTYMNFALFAQVSANSILGPHPRLTDIETLVNVIHPMASDVLPTSFEDFRLFTFGLTGSDARRIGGQATVFSAVSFTAFTVDAADDEMWLELVDSTRRVTGFGES